MSPMSKPAQGGKNMSSIADGVKKGNMVGVPVKMKPAQGGRNKMSTSGFPKSKPMPTGAPAQGGKNIMHTVGFSRKG